MSDEFESAELLEEFRDEARGQLDRLDAVLLRLDREGTLPEPDRIEVQRALHTMKGNAAMIGLGPLRDIAHEVESVFKAERGDWPRQLIDQLFAAAAAVRRAVERLEPGDPRRALAELSPPELTAGPQEQGPPTPADDAPADDALTDESPDEEAPGPDDAPIDSAGDLIRVAPRRLDALMERMADLFSLHAEIEAWAGENANALRAVDLARDAEGFVDRLEGLAGRIRGSVMEMRAVPASRVLRRFPTVARELAARQGKRVRVELTGEGTEVDKGVLDGLAEPLLHLVRNAVDHGIEPPEIRQERRKDPEGVIRIAAGRAGDVIEIVIEDDGAGLDIAAVRQTAGVDAVSDDDALHRVIFQPGFTTREEATDVSGRGIGLDVVRSSIRRLRGTVTAEGGGAGGLRFRIVVPVSIAILPTLLFEYGDEPLAIATGDVVETVRRPTIHSVGGVPSVTHERGDTPIVDPGAVFGWDVRVPSPAPFAILLRAGARTIALPATAMIDQRRAVVRPVPPTLGRVEGVSGVTVLPSGRTVLLLDPSGLSELSLRHSDLARPRAG